jgi:hypothetical protein
VFAYVRECGSRIFQSDFQLDFSKSGWAVSGTNTALLFLGFLVLLVLVAFPILVTLFGNLARDEWSRHTGLAADQNPLEFFEIKKTNKNG